MLPSPSAALNLPSSLLHQCMLPVPRSRLLTPTHAGMMGQVRFVQRGAVEQQLAAGNLVLLTNIGVSSAGELLNCNSFDVSVIHDAVCFNVCRPACCAAALPPALLGRCSPRNSFDVMRCGAVPAALLLCTAGCSAAPAPCAPCAAHLRGGMYESHHCLLCLPHPRPHPTQQVATHAAVELQADKLLLLTGADVRELELPHYLPLVRTRLLLLLLRRRRRRRGGGDS